MCSLQWVQRRTKHWSSQVHVLSQWKQTTEEQALRASTTHTAHECHPTGSSGAHVNEFL